MKAKLILENGMEFEGTAFGKFKDVVGEVVFNTGMIGYQEVMTDPSYHNQIVVMTYPLIGNYGVNLEDGESKTPKISGFVAREFSKTPSDYNSEITIESYLKNNGVSAIEGLDTRAIVKVLREHGTMRGIITSGEKSYKDVIENIRGFKQEGSVSKVTTDEIIKIDGSGKKIAIMDFGIKKNIVNNFIKRNCDITIFPAFTESEEILKGKFDMVFLSNGPGDPKELSSVVENIKKMVGKVPISGICLGHQLISLAMGGNTNRLKFGHRGFNHPVIELKTNKVMMTSQNHGYVVTKMPEKFEVTHRNVNDLSIEGIQSEELSIRCVQFHPEASPGPIEAETIFDNFLELIK